MKVALGCDHGALEYKNILVELLGQVGYEVVDCGTYNHDSVDYSDFVAKVCNEVQTNQCERGIVLCGTGIGVSIAANKHKGIRCALVSDIFSARATRDHNDTNVLAMGQRVLGVEVMKEIALTWLKTPFSNDPRHVKRIEKVNALDK